jgi:enoyl-CoA hydratase/carnithine racemase
MIVRDLFLGGRRLTAGEALLRGIIDYSVAPDEVYSTGVALGRTWANKPRESFAVLKRELSRAAIEILDPSGDLWWWQTSSSGAASAKLEWTLERFPPVAKL